MSYYLAPSLEVLRAEINTRWPRRDKASDGWIGDPAHQARRSDHNPNERGSVDAADFDEDGIDPWEVIAAVERHPSSHYWIYEGQIADRDDNWRRRPYTGSNKHTKHLHVSIRQTRTAEQDRRPWGLLEDDMALTDAQAKQLANVERMLGKLLKGSLTPGPDGKPENAATFHLRSALDAADPVLKDYPDWKTLSPVGLKQVGAQLAALRADVTALAGRDVVDEQQVAAELAPALLAVLTPQAIAAAVPAEFVRQVADELAARLRD